MPQIQLPIFPHGAMEINHDLAILGDGQTVVYYYGHLPVFTHPVEDLASFRMFTSQLIVNGSASMADIVQAFGVSLTTVKRCLRRFREGGTEAFYVPPAPRVGSRLTPEKLADAREALLAGSSVPEVAAQTGVLANTLHKAIRSGRLPVPLVKKNANARLLHSEFPCH